MLNMLKKAYAVSYEPTLICEELNILESNPNKNIVINVVAEDVNSKMTQTHFKKMILISEKNGKDNPIKIIATDVKVEDRSFDVVINDTPYALWDKDTSTISMLEMPLHNTVSLKLVAKEIEII